MDSHLLTKILILVSYLSAVYGCSCLKGHHQEDFCRAAYGMYSNSDHQRFLKWL